MQRAARVIPALIRRAAPPQARVVRCLLLLRYRNDTSSNATSSRTPGPCSRSIRVRSISTLGPNRFHHSLSTRSSNASDDLYVDLTWAVTVPSVAEAGPAGST